MTKANSLTSIQMVMKYSWLGNIKISQSTVDINFWIEPKKNDRIGLNQRNDGNASCKSVFFVFDFISTKNENWYI